ncbi:glycosyltransferase [Nonomuraea longicatena]|uniref:4,4'-diaponeurosporenoate glycosyltransferase n=1 Tax=Nonomuraea longicatena TaxID=83682 RepID=A0ABN1R6B1_9ACTN
MDAVAGVVIPAHNEESVIAAGLARLLAGAAAGEFEVIVVANACTDATAAVAARAGVRVLETPVPGKAHALRLGDAACGVFPRVYADADVGLDAGSVRALAAELARPGVLAAAPRPVWDLSGATWVARRVHRVHDALVGPHRALAGVGVYALGAEGHARVFPLPDVLSDDGYVHASFASGERAVVDGATSVVRPARTVRAHLRRRVRVRLGNRQLAELGRPVNAVPLRLGDLAALLRARRVSGPAAACYLSVLLADRILTGVRRGRPANWGTDTSSR